MVVVAPILCHQRAIGLLQGVTGDTFVGSFKDARKSLRPFLSGVKNETYHEKNDQSDVIFVNPLNTA